MGLGSQNVKPLSKYIKSKYRIRDEISAINMVRALRDIFSLFNTH